MDKMRMESPDFTQVNIEKLAEIFPNVITETRGDDGKLKKAVNFELLQQLLSKDLVQGSEAYEFTWVGKKESIREAGRPIRKTLRPCVEESKNWDSTENLYIEGDNLDVLKLLQESYLGKIKMIYIDPPYNTGNDFVYKDNFAMSKDEYDEEAGVYDVDGDKLFRNTESNGRFHSDWCSMMYPRLMLARNLLSDDGVIFISCDDNEQDNLKKICIEIFGQANFIATIVWKHTEQSKNDERHFSRQFNYLLCFTKNITKVHNFYFPRTDEDNINYSNPDNDPKGLWRSGDVRSPNLRNTLKFNIVAPNGNVISPPDNGWRWSEESIKQKIKTGEIIFKKDNSGIIRKIYLCDQIGRTPENLWSGNRFGTTRQATAVIKEIFNTAVFDTPKPLELIFSAAQLASSTDSIVLDFFSGSATTAHAVMQLNAEDGGNRKFIMVQLPENCPIDSEAVTNGYKTICDIGKERIRRAGEKIKSEQEAKENATVPDIGFRVLKVDDTNMKDVFYAPAQYSQKKLTDLIDNIKPDRNELDLLFSCILELGLPLTYKHSTETIDGKTIHTYHGGSQIDLMACFDKDVTEKVIKHIAQKKPIGAVFKDQSLNASARINVTEIFKAISPATDIKVI